MTDAMSPATRAAVLRRRAERDAIEIDVTGPSMGTSVPSGARVTVVAGRSPRRGEIWAFVLDDGTLVIHRFRRARAGTLWFQGDANPAVDRPVPPAHLVGRVVAIDAGGRRRVVGRAARVMGRLQLDLSALRKRAFGHR